MKPSCMKGVAILAGLMILSSASLVWSIEPKSTGIGFRGTYWKMTDNPELVSVSNHFGNTSVSVGSGGGWLYLFSRVNDYMFFELSLGAIGNVEETTTDYYNYYESDQNVDVFAVTPILLGLRYELLSAENQSGLRPYISLGGGPYWISTVNVTQSAFYEEVTVLTEFNRGGYAGGGANFMLTNWLGVNIDMKYHFIDFNKNNKYSGYEWGFGFCVMWGDYKL